MSLLKSSIVEKAGSHLSEVIRVVGNALSARWVDQQAIRVPAARFAHDFA
jgi:hypothetical protein